MMSVLTSFFNLTSALMPTVMMSPILLSEIDVGAAQAVATKAKSVIAMNFMSSNSDDQTQTT